MNMFTRERTWIAPGLFWAFLAGVALGWWLRGGAPTPATALARAGSAAAPQALSTPLDEPPSLTRIDRVNGLNAVKGVDDGSSVDERRAGDSLSASSPRRTSERPTVPTIGVDPISELRHRHLRLPLAEVNVEALKGSFAEGRDRGKRPHEAVDIMAPRNTPIQAVEDGVIAKLFSSRAGGLTVYQFDPTGNYCYYYAHLEKYARGLKEGMQVRAGDTLGYVGSSGNASPNAPHLHFAIFRLTDAHRWSQGTPIDPYRVFSDHDRR